MSRGRTLNKIPDAPGRIPGLGHLVSMSRDLPKLLRSMAERDAPIQRLHMPFSSDIHVWTSSASLSLLSQRDLSAKESAKLGHVVFGHTSMLSSDGADHRRRRAASQAPFTPKGLSRTGVSDIITEVVTARCSSMVKRRQVRLLDETQVLSLEILFRVMGVPSDELDAWASHYNTMLRGLFSPRWNIPGLPHHRALAARRWVDDRLGRYVEAARRDPEARGIVAELVRGRDDEGAGLDEIELFDNLRLLILAGHETTASILAWMVAYLAALPDLRSRLLDEARAGEGLPCTAQELRSYPLAEALFRECLRLHPPITIAHRTALSPTVVEGFEIPEGTVLGIPLWLLGRAPEAFEHPERFDPDRWIRRQRKLSPIELSAFGSGPHFCLGFHMALIEGVQFILALLREMDDADVRPEMDGLPSESYLPTSRPRAAETRCRFVSC